MDIFTIGATVSIFTAFVMAVIVLHPEIHEGVIVKGSLIVCIFSLLATAAIVLKGPQYSQEALLRAGTMLRIGLAGVCAGILYRAHVLGQIRRKIEKECEQRYRTRTILNIIIEPVHNIAFLFTSDFAKLEQENKRDT